MQSRSQWAGLVEFVDAHPDAGLAQTSEFGQAVWIVYREPARGDGARGGDAAGRRFWIYRRGFHRQGEPAVWYLHGFFA